MQNTRITNFHIPLSQMSFYNIDHKTIQKRFLLSKGLVITAYKNKQNLSFFNDK